MNTSYHSNNGSKLTDPTYIGPGVWWLLHTSSASVKDENTYLAFLKIIENISEKFPCNKCRNHFKEYISNNNIYLKLDYKKNPKGLFKWTWECHNNANKSTGKPNFDYIEAEKLYYDPTFCSTSCGANEVHTNPTPTFTQITPVSSSLPVNPKGVIIRGMN